MFKIFFLSELKSALKRPMIYIFLGLITVFAIIMMAFPYYANQLFSDRKITNKNIEESNSQNLELKIVGMTCSGCETFIEQTVSTLGGIDFVKANYKSGSAFVIFDSTKTNRSEIINSIDKTSYKVKE